MKRLVLLLLFLTMLCGCKVDIAYPNRTIRKGEVIQDSDIIGTPQFIWAVRDNQASRTQVVGHKALHDLPQAIPIRKRDVN